jgi:flagellin
MRINNNISAMNTYRQMTNASNASAKSMEKLSTGLRINRAADDAAGLAISEKMRAQIRGLDQAAKNSQDGISMIQTSEGAMGETQNILQRMRELAVQSSNGTNTDEERKALDTEMNQLREEIDGIASRTEFNGKKLLDGSLTSSGAAAGTNTTNGSTILTQTKAAVESSKDFATGTNGSAINFATADSIKIDSVTVSVNWEQKLSDYEKTLVKGDYDTSGTGTQMDATQEAAIKSAIERVINESISEHNAANGTNVGQVKLYEAADSAAAGDSVLYLESSTAGDKSEINFSSSSATGVLKTFFGTGVSDTGQNQIIENIAATDKLSFEINGVRLQTGVLTGANAGDNASTVATDIQAKLRTAIDQYNNDAGLSAGMEGFIDDQKVFVEAKDGRFTVKSDSGSVGFIEQEGSKTVANLGLTRAQTDSAGNGGVTFQVGSNRGQTITFGVGDMRTTTLGIANISLKSQAGASQAMETIDKALKSVSSERAKLGAIQNRLEYSINNLNTTSENLTSAESRIRDVDMAKEVMTNSKNSILAQAAQAMLAQANQQPQGVLQLLR